MGTILDNYATRVVFKKCMRTGKQFRVLMLKGDVGYSGVVALQDQLDPIKEHNKHFASYAIKVFPKQFSRSSRTVSECS